MTIKIKKKTIQEFVVVGNVYFSVGNLMHFWKKGTEFLKGLQFAPTSVIPSQWFFFVWRRHSFQPVISNMSRYQSFPRGWLSESFPGGNKKNTSRWKRPKGRPRTAWIWSVENDLTPQNISLHSDLRQAKIDRAGVKLLHVICQWWWWYLW